MRHGRSSDGRVTRDVHQKELNPIGGFPKTDRIMLKYLVKKEFLQMRRNAFLPRLLLMFPIVIMCVMPWVMNMEVKNIRVSVVDLDRSVRSARLTQRIAASPHFIFCGLKADNAAAIRSVEQGDCDIVVTIPQHYSRDITQGRMPQTLVAANAMNGTKGGMGANYLSNIIVGDLPRGSAPQPTVTELNLYNKNLDYKVFMIPALMSILVLMLCGFLPALNIVGEKEKGTIEQINVTPVSRRCFIASKLLPYWTVGMVVLSLCFVLSWLVYGIVPQGNLALLYFASMLFALCVSGLGLVISNNSDTMQQAIFVMWFFVVCMTLLSGLFTPVSSMPEWAQTLTLANPIRHYIDIMRTVFVRGGTLPDVVQPLATLTAMAAAIDLWAVVSYKKNG